MDITKTFVQFPYVKISVKGTEDEKRGFLTKMLNIGAIKTKVFEAITNVLSDDDEIHFFANEELLVRGLSALTLARMDEQTHAKLRLQRRKTKCRHTFDRWLVAQALRVIRSWRTVSKKQAMHHDLEDELTDVFEDELAAV